MRYVKEGLVTDVAEAAQEFRDLAKNLALVGLDELRTELYKAIDEAAQPIQYEVRRALPGFLPNRYAEVLDGDLAIRTSKRTGTDPGIRIVATGRGRGGVQRRRIRRLNQGTLWHPTFGDRKAGRYQAVTPGFFDRPIEDSAPQVREAILAAMERIAEKAVGR